MYAYLYLLTSPHYSPCLLLSVVRGLRHIVHLQLSIMQPECLKTTRQSLFYTIKIPVTIIPTEGATDRPKNVVVPTPAYMLALKRPHFHKFVFSLDLSWPCVKKQHKNFQPNCFNRIFFREDKVRKSKNLQFFT